MVIEMDGVCTDVTEIEDVWCLGLLLCQLECLCERLCRAVTGCLAASARPLRCLEFSLTAAGAGSLC